SEVIFALMGHHLRHGSTLSAAVSQVFAQIHGAATIACFVADRDAVIVATNTGSLYYAAPTRAGAFVFTSDRFILEQLIRGNLLGGEFRCEDIVHVEPGNGVIIDTRNVRIDRFRFDEPRGDGVHGDRRSITDRSPSFATSNRQRRCSDLDSVAALFPHVSL